MLRTIYFYLDENCPNGVADGLRRRGIDVTTTPVPGIIDETDEEQTAHALAQGRVIFAQDRDFLAIDAAGVPHAGIVYCRRGERTIGQIIAGLTQVWETMEPEQMKQWLIYL